MKVLVTGATGFIGRAIVKELLYRGHNVVASARNETDMEGCEFIPYEINGNIETENLFEYFGKPDLLIHCAWDGLPNYESRIHIDQVGQHFYFIENLVYHGLKDYAVIGTCLEYGKRNGMCREDFPTNPTTAYGLAKKELYSELSKLDCLFKWFRLFYVYGDGQRGDTLLEQIKKCNAQGQERFKVSEVTRDFIEINEAVKLICDCAIQKQTYGIINISSGNPQKISDFAMKFILDNNLSIRLTHGYPKKIYEPDFFYGDTHKLNKICKRLRK